MKLTSAISSVMAALAIMPAANATAENVVINGNIIDWYYYGKDIHSSNTGWYQMPVGGIDTPANLGMFQIAIDPSSTKEDKYVGMDFMADNLRNHVLYSNAGGVFTGDYFYSFFMHETPESQESNEEYGSEDWEILIRKWDLETGKYETLDKRLPAQPTDLTYDPINDRVYGIFRIFTEEEDYYYELCELDMETFEVRQISHEMFDTYQDPRALAINSKGEIYGITQRGEVLKFDKETGACTRVGNTGFCTQERMMSAAFDFRTDKLYWLGYVNDGIKDHSDTSGSNNHLSIAEGGRDTGIFEVNTTTGVATLLSKPEHKEFDYEAMKLNWAGKVQMTGIWVDGSFEKADQDLKVDLVSAPQSLKAGETGEIQVKVKNIGKNLIGEDDWSVELQAGGAKVASKSGRDLEKGESRVVKFAYTAPASGPVALTAVIVSDKDQVAANNSTAEFTIQVVPGGIKGDVDGDGEVDTNDLNAVINALVGKGSASNTDVDGDGITDVSDVNALINLVLGKGM